MKALDKFCSTWYHAHLFVKIPRPRDNEDIFRSSSQAATYY